MRVSMGRLCGRTAAAAAPYRAGDVGTQDVESSLPVALNVYVDFFPDDHLLALATHDALLVSVATLRKSSAFFRFSRNLRVVADMHPHTTSCLDRLRADAWNSLQRGHVIPLFASISTTISTEIGLLAAMRAVFGFGRESLEWTHGEYVAETAVSPASSGSGELCSGGV